MSIIIKQGQSYNAGDVQVNIMGDLNLEVTKVVYDVKQSHKANYSVGCQDPTSYSVGKKEYTCTLGLRLASIAQLEKAAGGSLLDIKPFNIIVTYVNDENEIITDRLLVKFKEQGRSVSSDDEDGVKEFEMFCLGIEFNKK
jgi:hypothetical protein